MQSSSTLSGLSCLENIERRFPLRSKQKECAEYIIENPSSSVYVYQLVTGYGKSYVAIMSYAILRAMGRATRVLFVVPTDTQRSQYLKGIMKDAKDLGIKISGVLEADGATHAIKSSNLNKVEVFVTSIQKINADPDYFADLMEKGVWVIKADECHKYSRTGEWGKALMSLPADIYVGLSATPLRSSGQYGVLGGPCVENTLREAREESAIRGIRVHAEDYFVDIMNEDGEVKRLTTKNMAEFLESNHVSDMTEYMLKNKIRYSSKYISSAFYNITSALHKKRLDTGAKHQAIVFAMNCEHAKHLASAFTKTGAGLKADWICTSRDKHVNSDILSKFECYELDILIQVSMASEGFNSKHTSVIAYMNLWNQESNTADQSIGRGLRRDNSIDHENDILDVFIPEDNGLAEYFKTLESSVNSDDDIPPITTIEADQEVCNGDEDYNPMVTMIPTYNIIDVEYKGEEIFTPLDPELQEKSDMLVKNYTDNNPNLNMDTVRRDVEQLVREYNTPARSEAEIRKHASDSVTSAANIYVNNLLRMRYGRSIEQSAKADMYRKVNGELKRQFGAKESLTESELRVQYDFIRNYNNMLGSSSEVPEWAEL